MKLTFKNKTEQLEYEIETLKRSSGDPQFTAYLNSVLEDVKKGTSDPVFLRRKLIENYDIYVSRMNALRPVVEPMYFKAIYGNMEAPEILEVSALEGKDYSVQNPMPQVAPMPQSSRIPPQAQMNNAAPAQVSKTAEYAVGAIVMSIVGSVFLLFGLVYLAVHFLDSFMQGMLMYVACIAVLLVSELVVRRFVPKLSAVFTAIGISGLYLTTVVNYRSLNNISLIASAIILGLVAILVCIFGYVRKSQIYSVIGFMAAFISSVAIGTDASGGEFLFITFGTLLISCLWLIFPVKKYYGVLATVMMISEFLYVPFALSIRIKSVGSLDTSLYKMIFVAASWVIIEFVYFTFIRFTKADGKERGDLQTANMIIMIILSVIYSFISIIGFYDSDAMLQSKIVFGIIVFALYILPELAFTFITYKNDYYYAITYFITLIITGILTSICPGTIYFTAPVVCIFALAMRYICSKKPDRTSYKIMDIMVQIALLLFILIYSGEYRPDAEHYFGMIVLTISALGGLYIVGGFNTVVWILVMTAVSFGSIRLFLPDEIFAATSMGIILILTYVKNTFDRFKGKNTLFNWFALIYEIIFLLGASDNTFSAYQVVVFSIASIFGLAFTILILNKEYGFPFSGKFIAIPVYLTIVCFLSPIESGFIISIILMIIAVVSVVIGFALKEKAIRVYGLVLSILICGKIALIDFASIGDVLYKTIMYIFVGILALSIGCIYMILEVRENKKNKPAGFTGPANGYVPYGNPVPMNGSVPMGNEAPMNGTVPVGNSSPVSGTVPMGNSMPVGDPGSQVQYGRGQQINGNDQFRS